MKKCLYLFLFVAAAQAVDTRDEGNARYEPIPTPSILYHEFFANPTPSFVVYWIPVFYDRDPIARYRLDVLEEIEPNSDRFQTYQIIDVFGGGESFAAVSEIEPGRRYRYLLRAVTTGDRFGPQASRTIKAPWPRNNGGRQEPMAFTVDNKEIREDKIFSVSE